MLGEPLAAGQAGHQGFIEAALGAVIEVLKRRAGAQFGLLQAGAQAAGGAHAGLPIEQQAEAFLKAQTPGRGLLELFLEGVVHARQAQALERLQGRMDQHRSVSSARVSPGGRPGVWGQW